MPIYEFRCLECENLFELLVLNDDEKIELGCPSCQSENFERVMSATHYSMGDYSGAKAGAKTQTRTCPGGSCTTYDIPGPAR